MLTFKTKNYYNLSKDEVLEELKTSTAGLSKDEVLKRQAEYGRNILPRKKPPTIFEIILSQILNPLIYILIAAAVFALVAGDVKDSVFIFLVIIINAGIGAFQEWKAEKSSQALEKMLKISARVIRDGKEILVESEELVPGDIVLVESGSKVPADMRLFEVNNARIDEALLTGESVAIEKIIDFLEGGLLISEQKNMAFAGSVVTSGRAKGVVTSIGLNTEIGKIAESITSIDTSKPPLIVRIEKFAKQVSIIVLIAAAILAALEIIKGQPIKEVFFLATALAVSAIPEGLPAALTVALSVGMSRMSSKNVIIKRLSAVEGLGSCTTIASDKTGTLTMNKQTAKVIQLANGRLFSITGEGYSGEGDILDENNNKLVLGQDNQLDNLIKAGVIANEASLYKSNDEWESQGDAVDIAILALGYKAGIESISGFKNSLNIICEIPFESERGFSATVYEEEGRKKISVKGAFEILSKICKNDTEVHQSYVSSLAKQEYRVIALAEGSFNEEADPEKCNIEDMSNLTLTGFIGLIDPLRPEAKEAAKKCKEAGVRVIMITGDHPETAYAIGNELGIVDSKEQIMSGKELFHKSNFEEFINKINIFARVTPIQKMELVQALKDTGNFVAVTGDGVNDAPAIKKANIGVAMGSGTDISKDVSSIIVTDDNFASIVDGIEQGRFTYDNVRKVIYLLVATGAAEIVLFFLSLMFGLPIPLVAVQLLWLNLVTNGIQGVALAFEAGEKGSMKIPPRNPSEGIFNHLMIKETIVSGFFMAIVAFGVWFYLLKIGFEETLARNYVLLLMVLFENFQVFNCRSEKTSAFKIPIKNNYVLIIGVFGALGLHILSMYIPVMQDILGLQPVSFINFAILLGLASLLLLTMELFKILNKEKKSEY